MDEDFLDRLQALSNLSPRLADTLVSINPLLWRSIHPDVQKKMRLTRDLIVFRLALATGITEILDVIHDVILKRSDISPNLMPGWLRC